jgi:hypothetical protein
MTLRQSITAFVGIFDSCQKSAPPPPATNLIPYNNNLLARKFLSETARAEAW